MYQVGLASRFVDGGFLSPFAPTGLKVTVNATGFIASWSAVNGATDYIVYHDGAKLSNTNGATTWTFTDSPGPHTLAVSVVDASGKEQGQCPPVRYTDGDYVFDNGYGKPVEARWFLRKLSGQNCAGVK